MFINLHLYSKSKALKYSSGQGGKAGKFCAFPATTIPKLPLNYKTTTMRNTWRLTKQEFYNCKYKEEATLRVVGVGGDETCLSHIYMCHLRTGRDISIVEVPPKEWGVPAPHQAPAQESSVRKRNPRNS